MIVASMASMAGRAGVLRRVVESILPQVDRLNVYLNGYERVPDCLLHRKVPHVMLSGNAGWRGPEAKWWFVDPTAYAMPPGVGEDDIHFTLDDDLIYPPDYVRAMLACLERHPRSIIACHASVMVPPFEDYRRDRYIFRWGDGLGHDVEAHIPGTGTACYRLGDLPVRVPGDFPYPKMVDPQIAVLAKAHGIEVWSPARPPGWLGYLRPPRGSTIYEQRTGRNKHEVENELLHSVAPWKELPIGDPSFHVKYSHPARPMNFGSAKLRALEAEERMAAIAAGANGSAVEGV